MVFPWDGLLSSRPISVKRPNETMSKYWTIVLPAALCTIGWLAYTAEGWFGRWAQNLLKLLLNVGAWILNFIFGI